ncbi:SCP2 sterol-binding domain-containing protein [Haloechinothrix salitolerans]|uniref:SCP2 sterol-binding domain-containing protein n=1 Tax=Haloechinothrix salitolerans TaxID=926830 RepID=UPI0031E8C5AF
MEATKGIRETYQYRVGVSAFYFAIDDGSIQFYDGCAEDPAVVVTTDEETWRDIASGKTTTSAAAASGALTISGDRQTTKCLGRIFSRKEVRAAAKAAITAAHQH